MKFHPEGAIAGCESHARAFDVVGLGQCALDVLGQIPAYPQVDSKTELSSLLIQGGGPVATALVTLARLGASAAFFGRVGDDDFGVKIREGLLAEGIDCRWLFTETGATSQFAFIAVEQGRGRRNIFWHRGSAPALAPADIDPSIIAGSRVLHLDGLQHEASMAAARIARDAGVTTVLDGGSFREHTAELLPLIDHLVVSEKFVRQAGGDTPLRAALEGLADRGAQAVTVTLGEEGSHTLSDTGETFHQPAFDVAAIDTTGCGDVFHGGYIHGLLQKWPLRRTVRFAAACAALKARALGGRTAIPRREEVEAFLNRTPGC